jgi:hypothetical protein
LEERAHFFFNGDQRQQNTSKIVKQSNLLWSLKTKTAKCDNNRCVSVMVHPSSRECTLALFFRPISFSHLQKYPAKSREEARRVAREFWYIFLFLCVTSVCVLTHTTQRHFFLSRGGRYRVPGQRTEPLGD